MRAMTTTGIDPARISALLAREDARFVEANPRSMAMLDRGRGSMPRGVPMSWMDDLYEHPPIFVEGATGAHFRDVDGHTYLDLYIGDMATFCGHAPEPVVRAVSAQVAKGSHFMLPGEDALVVAEHLAERYRLPKWQFTLSATQANTEVIRLARQLTGRDVVLMFDGKYHGHGDATLVTLDDGAVVAEELGVPRWVTGAARIVDFNDLDAVERALAPRDVAVLLMEPAMTNAGVLWPEPGFHDGIRRLTREHGTLLAMDETHSLVTAYGGVVGELGLEPDVLIVGKSVAGGIPLGAYGMRDEIAATIAPPPEPYTTMGMVSGQVATGSTLSGNPVSMAAARAALTEVLTAEAFDRARALGARMADGLEAAIRTVGLDWSVSRMGPHAYYGFGPRSARNARESREVDDPNLRALIRVWLANRGVWESGWWLGPTVSVAHTDADVDAYVAAFGACLADLAS
jgi:glutamate-1-semialdehyde 2,1-aminomutase